MAQSLATQITAAPPRTFAEFKALLCSDALADVTNASGQPFPIELVRDITEGETELIRKVLGYEAGQQYALLVIEFLVFNLHFTANDQTQDIQSELRGWGKAGVSVPVLFFLGLCAFNSQYFRGYHHDLQSLSAENLSQNKIWAVGLCQYLDNLIQGCVEFVPDVNGRVNWEATRFLLPGEWLKLEIDRKVEELQMKSPLRKLKRFLETAMANIERVHQERARKAREIWPIRTNMKVPEVRQAFIGIRDLLVASKTTTYGANEDAVRYLDFWGVDCSTETARRWYRESGHSS